MLECLTEELHDAPLFYTLTGLAMTLKVDTMKHDTLRNALVNAGYCVSGTHCNPNGVKTDAPPEVCHFNQSLWISPIASCVSTAVFSATTTQLRQEC